MPLRVNHNISAFTARRHLSASNRVLGTRIERLASGLRVNRASDDAAGLSVREGMRSEIAGLEMNIKNAEQGTNLLQVAEGSLNEVNAILVRMRELATQSASSTINDKNRESLQAEFSQLIQEVDRIAQATTYNNQVLLTGYGNTVSTVSTVVSASNASGVTGVRISGAGIGTYTFEDAASDGELTLGNGTITQTIRISTQLDGATVATGTQVVANFDRLGIQVTLAGNSVPSATGSYTDGDLNGQNIIIEGGTGGSFQVGPTDLSFNRIEVNIKDMSASGPNLNLNTASIATLGNARSSLSVLEQAITTVAQQRGDLGAFQNRLSFSIAYTENEIENIQASEASISDADVAREVTEFSRSQILVQSSQAMLAQANVSAVSALSLL